MRKALVDNPIPFDASDADAGREQRTTMLKQLDDYIIPRLVQVDAPLLAVRSVRSVDTNRACRPTLRLGNSKGRYPHIGGLQPLAKPPP